MYSYSMWHEGGIAKTILLLRQEVKILPEYLFQVTLSYENCRARSPVDLPNSIYEAEHLY